MDRHFLLYYYATCCFEALICWCVLTLVCTYPNIALRTLKSSHPSCCQKYSRKTWFSSLQWVDGWGWGVKCVSAWCTHFRGIWGIIPIAAMLPEVARAPLLMRSPPSWLEEQVGRVDRRSRSTSRSSSCSIFYCSAATSPALQLRKDPWEAQWAPLWQKQPETNQFKVGGCLGGSAVRKLKNVELREKHRCDRLSGWVHVISAVQSMLGFSCFYRMNANKPRWRS